VAETGFNDFFSRYDGFEFSESAHEYRQRFLIVAMRSLVQRIA